MGTEDTPPCPYCTKNQTGLYTGGAVGTSEYTWTCYRCNMRFNVSESQ